MKPLTIVYFDIEPGDEACLLTENPKAKKFAWNDLMDERNVLEEALRKILVDRSDSNAALIAAKALNAINRL